MPVPPAVVHLAPADEQMIRYVRDESAALAEQLRNTDARSSTAGTASALHEDKRVQHSKPEFRFDSKTGDIISKWPALQKNGEWGNFGNAGEDHKPIGPGAPQALPPQSGTHCGLCVGRYVQKIRTR